MKRCSTCKHLKKESDFTKNKSTKDGLHNQCRDCRKNYTKKTVRERSARRKAFRENNKEKIKEQKRQYYLRNRDSIIAKRSTPEAKTRLAKNQRLYRQKNPGLWSKYCGDRYRTDKHFKIQKSLRGRLTAAIRNSQKVGSAVHDLGCSIEELIVHLEAQFYDERMSWETWGKEWHIDHIYPLSQADLEDRVQFLAVNNWRNLQPLTIADNLDKNNKILPEAQLLFDELCDMFQKKEEAA